MVPKPPAPSQCYSELEDISDQIRHIDCKHVTFVSYEPPSHFTFRKADELRQLEAFTRVDSVPLDVTHSTSLGKRDASDISGQFGPPVSKRPRMIAPPDEEPQTLLPVEAETPSAASALSPRDIPFIIVSNKITFFPSGHQKLKLLYRHIRIISRSVLILGSSAAAFSGRLPDSSPPNRRIRRISLSYLLIVLIV